MHLHKDVIRVVGRYNNCPLITFAYRKGQLVNIAAEKTSEEHLNEAAKRLGKKLGVIFNDYALYVDSDAPVSRYVMFVEPDRPMPIDSDGKMGKMLGEILSEVNVEYQFFADVRGSIDTPLVLIQQQETHALWREYKLLRGSSSNQIKPVRIFDVPEKQRFFFRLLEKGQNVSKWDFFEKKK